MKISGAQAATPRSKATTPRSSKPSTTPRSKSSATTPRTQKATTPRSSQAMKKSFLLEQLQDEKSKRRGSFSSVAGSGDGAGGAGVNNTAAAAAATATERADTAEEAKERQEICGALSVFSIHGLVSKKALLGRGRFSAVYARAVYLEPHVGAARSERDHPASST